MEPIKPEQVELDELSLIAALEQSYSWKDLDDALGEKQHPPSDVLYSALCCPEDYRRWYGYFNELTNRKEVSKRLLDLTKLLLVICSSNYYALMARLDCYRALKPSLQQEVKLINQLLRDNSKEYQLWNYRKSLQPHKSINTELQFLDELLREDNKHYHVWSYRVWLIGSATREEQQSDLNTIEAQFKESYLKLGECYSAWSYRRFLQGKLGLLNDRNFVEEELKHLLELLKKQPENECVWNILHGLFQHDNFGISQYPVLTLKYPDFPQVQATCQTIANRFSLVTQLKISQSSQDSGAIRASLMQLIQADPTRSSYWTYLLESS